MWPEQGASPLVYSGGQGARKVRTLDIPFPRLVLAHRGLHFGDVASCGVAQETFGCLTFVRMARLVFTAVSCAASLSSRLLAQPPRFL